MSGQQPFTEIAQQREAHFKAWASTADEVWRPESAHCDACREPWPCTISGLLDCLASVAALADKWEADQHSDLTQRACAALLHEALNYPPTQAADQ